jgi:subtilisin-like proprotein convertase family protein
LLGPGEFQDKNWISVDNFAGVGQHNVYLCWTRFGAAGLEEVRFTSSTDGGATFGPNLGTLVSTGGQGCFLTVSPDHSISMFYFRGTGAGGQGGDNKIFVRRSTDLGATFGAEVQVADLLTTTVNGDLGLVGGFRTNSFPHAAANPINGHLYVVFNDNPSDADNADSYYVKSVDNGATWSVPVQLNNDDAARDQFMPTVAVSTTGTSLMFGYYSRANDGVAFHRQGRIGTVNTITGAVALRPSFQLGPDTPIVLGQDPTVNATYMGDYDQIASTAGFFHSSWADNRKGNTFHAHQPDVQYARINAAAPSTNPAVVLTAPASATLGTNILVRATLTNSGVNRAEDMFGLITLPAGLVPKAVVPSGGGKCYLQAQLVGCTLGSIDPGGSKTVDLTAFVSSAGAKATRATLTTSGTDASAANNTSTVATSVTGAGVSKTYSTGNIAVPIPDTASVDIPLDVPDEGSILSVSARVRLDHTFDSDLSLFLISPTGTIVELSSNNGADGDNYGSGTNTCAGTKTTFADAAATSITAGVAPFAGTFKPEQAQGLLASENPQGGWVLRVVDSVAGDVGTVGCVQATITRSP